MRILGEGRYEVPDPDLPTIERLDAQLVAAMEAADEATFSTTLSELLDEIRRKGALIPPDDVRTSGLAVPHDGSTLVEVRSLLDEEGSTSRPEDRYMGFASTEIEIGKPPEEVWAVVGDFGSIAEWMPGVESCVVDGDDRILKMRGTQITERLQSRDEDARVLVYGIVGGIPVGNHRATITVSQARGARSS